ncbi:MAG: YfjI family protein [Bdellovibrionota bacterium]
MKISNSQAMIQLNLGSEVSRPQDNLSTDLDPESWPDPIPLEAGHILSWPGNVFPEPVEQFLTALADYSETPIELSAMIALSVVAACAQGTWAVETRVGHTEPLPIWTLVALPPGNRKSSVFSEIVSPLRQYEKEEAVRLKPEIRKAEAQAEVLEAQKQKLTKSVKQSTDEAERSLLIEQLTQLSAMRVAIPRPPRLFSDDTTPEALTELLANHDGCMAILSDEGGIFETIAGRYDKKGSPNLDTCLKGHSANSSIRRDRVGGNGCAFIDFPHLTFGLCVQPDVVLGLRDKDGFRGRGFLARFLFCWPESKVGSRTLDTKPVPLELKQAWRQLIRGLLDARYSKVRGGPSTLNLSQEAAALFGDYARKVEADLKPGGRFEPVTDWASKLPGQVCRIAGLLHVMRIAHAGASVLTISETDMWSAIRMGMNLEIHALRVFDAMEELPELAGARRIRNWMLRTRGYTFSARDAYDQNRSFLKRRPALDPLLRVLEEHCMIFRVDEKFAGPGRPSERYEINPKLSRLS